MKVINKKLISPGIWNCTEPFPRFSQHQIPECIEQIDPSPAKRARICMHPSQEDRMQEMFIAFRGSSYVRPSYHTIDESFHIIDGYGKYLFFDLDGNFTNDVRLGPYHSDLPFYCRVPAKQAHSLILFSKEALAHEVIGGLFSRANTIFPAWSFDYQNEDEKAQFRNRYALEPTSPLLNCQFDQISEELFRTKPGFIALKRSDLNSLKIAADKTPRKQVHLSIHTRDDATLHETFLIHTDISYLRPYKLLGKDESFHILEGEADCVFFDEAGKVIEIVQLGDRSSNKSFFVRAPKNIFHTILMRSKHLVIQKALPGPYNPQDLLWAPWAQ
jgi:cupin fold WbuC family metalloprotein